ncbi:hypothetical protein BDV10DRAFT_179822 [Aspergillus recurvatus]
MRLSFSDHDQQTQHIFCWTTVDSVSQRRRPCIGCISCISCIFLLGTVCSPNLDRTTIAFPVRSITQPLCTTSGHRELPSLQRPLSLDTIRYVQTSRSIYAARFIIRPPSGV